MPLFSISKNATFYDLTLAFALNDEMSFVDAESHRKDVYGLETHFKRIIDTYEKVWKPAHSV